MINSTRWRQSGFTLIELVVAMGIFSAMLIVILNGFIMVTRIYDAGITSRTTQQNVRLILDDFVKNAHYSGKVDISHSPQVCLFKGTNTIFYALDSSGNLWRTTTSGSTCPVATPSAPTWQQLNDSTAKVIAFAPTVTSGVNGGQGTVSLAITVAARSNLENLFFQNSSCISGANGSQYCSVAALATTVYLSGGGN